MVGVRLADGTLTDLHVADGRLVDSAPAGAERMDADGLVALPGLVDLHTHLREPGGEDAETIATGTAAAARGGFTTVFAMPNTDPVTDTPERVAALTALAAGASARVIPIGSITRGELGAELSELAGMGRAGVRVFSDDGRCVMDAALMRRAMQIVRGFDGVLAQHAQDADLAGPTACCHESPVSERTGLEPWPEVAESVIVARDVQLAADTGARLHVCHVSSAESLEVIRWAKGRGVPVTCEVTPHHLLLGVERVVGEDTTFKVNPPLTSDENRDALRAALADGTIDIVATDHAPHTTAGKDQPFPLAKPGMIGLEQALAVVLELLVTPGLFGWPDVARVLSSAPAGIGRITGQGLPLVPGNPANLVLVDPAARARVDRDASASRGRNNPYHGLDLPDPVVSTMWAGRWTYRR